MIQLRKQQLGEGGAGGVAHAGQGAGLVQQVASVEEGGQQAGEPQLGNALQHVGGQVVHMDASLPGPGRGPHGSCGRS